MITPRSASPPHCGLAMMLFAPTCASRSALQPRRPSARALSKTRCVASGSPRPSLPMPRRWCATKSTHWTTCAARPGTNARWPASGRSALSSNCSTVLPSCQITSGRLRHQRAFYSFGRIVHGRKWLAMYDVAIVGGGPAGASAATFTARAGLQTVLIDADAGMTRRAMVNNHLGFPEGVRGPDLVDNGKLQAARAGAEVVEGKVVDLRKTSDDAFELRAEDGKSFD